VSPERHEGIVAYPNGFTWGGVLDASLSFRYTPGYASESDTSYLLAMRPYLGAQAGRSENLPKV
jgi:hypothetical protein